MLPIHSGILFSSKENEVTKFAGKRMLLENIIGREVTKAQKIAYVLSPLGI